ncbi:MAG: GspH/FimT family pseudopilin [Verrucomicrobiota bacterium]|jgi:prepilin-type N-terminal cleavage/methylation domain-containing protein
MNDGTGDKWRLAAGQKEAARSPHASRFTPRVARFLRRAPGFSLIEIMIVVAIIGLMAAMSVPSILQMYRKEGMRKAVGDITDVFSEARARAILQNQTVSVVFFNNDNHFEVHGGQSTGGGRIASSALPPGVFIAMLDINLQDCGDLPSASVSFYPDGTSDELTLVLHSSDEWRKITLEFATAIATVSDVDQ